MRIVLLSDIHANVTALQAVLEDINHIGSLILLLYLVIWLIMDLVPMRQ